MNLFAVLAVLLALLAALLYGGVVSGGLNPDVVLSLALAALGAALAWPTLAWPTLAWRRPPRAPL